MSAAILNSEHDPAVARLGSVSPLLHRTSAVRPTPYLDLDVGAAVTRYRRLAAALPGTAVHYAVKANPDPRLLRGARRGRMPLRRGQPGRGHAPRWRRGRGRATSSTPTRSSGARTSRSPAGSASPCSSSTRSRRPRRSPPPRPGRRCSAGSVTSGEGSDWSLSRKYGCSPDRGGADPALGRRASASTRPGSPSTSGRSSATPQAWDAAHRGGGAGLRGAARRRARRPGCSTSAAASPPTSRAGARRSRRTARRSSASCAGTSAARRPPTLVEPGRAVVADAGTLVTTVIGVVLARRHPLGVPRRRRLHRPGRDPRRGDPLPAAHQRRRRPDRAVRARRPDLRQRGRALRADAGPAAAVAAPRATRCGCSSTGAYTTCYSTVGLQRLRPLRTQPGARDEPGAPAAGQPRAGRGRRCPCPGRCCCCWSGARHRRRRPAPSG